MNWLAHLVLSEQSGEFRIGSLLPDLVRQTELRDLSPAMLAGVARHRDVDAYTDRHPVFLRSADRFPPPYRRFARILTDLIYDHFLSRSWADYVAVDLPQFLDRFFGEVKHHERQLPFLARERLAQIREEQWLAGYGDLILLQGVMQRVGRRLRRPVDLGPAIATLTGQYHDFQTDFEEFFHDIRLAFVPDLSFPLKA